MFPPTFKCCTIPVPLQLTTIRNCTLERKLEPEQSKCPMLIVSNECAILRDQFEIKNKQVEVGSMKDEEKYCDSASHIA
ncbi:hypothetical protein KY284_036510 [Solanum tuberosum]|nr:hypothetical protein KY284_036510 [Solanum tuberosum]